MRNKILVVASNYYKDITKKLINSACKKLNNYDYKIIYVPGIFEIPVTIAKNMNKYQGFIALGCVIKGKTYHFELISNSTTLGIMNLSIKYKKPIGDGIISSFNKAQAIKRTKKGKEAAEAVISILEQ